MNKLRWGILGAARIARKNWLAISNSGNSVVAVVASRDTTRAADFVRDCQAACPFETPPEVLGSYEDLLVSKNVDAVYIPLPTALRKEWVVRAAKAGKHVLCEKPCAVNTTDLREMTSACEQAGVQFMDGVMFMHCNRLPLLRSTLDDREHFGEIRRINSNFSFLAPEGFMESNIRANSALEPFGCLGDLGWYCVRFSLWAMRWQMPVRVQAHALNSHAGVPTEFSGELHFAGGVSAAFYCSFLANQEQITNVIGSKECVEFSDFVLPFTSEETSFNVRRNIPSIVGLEWRIETQLQRMNTGQHGSDIPTAQETNMFRNFAAQVLSGRLNSDWPAQALKTQIVVDACLASAQADGRLLDIKK